MEQNKTLKEPLVLDKIELLLPPRLTLKVVAIATERGQTINDILLEAVANYIEQSHQ